LLKQDTLKNNETELNTAKLEFIKEFLNERDEILYQKLPDKKDRAGNHSRPFLREKRTQFLYKQKWKKIISSFAGIISETYICTDK
jgi:hypothetical protein